MAASSSARLPSGQRSLSSATHTLIPSAVTGSPTMTLAGAACRPSSRSPTTASFACMHARDVVRAGAPPLAVVWIGSIVTLTTSAGGSTSSSSANPVRAALRQPVDGLCSVRVRVSSATSAPPLAAVAAARLFCHLCAAAGGGCRASKAACLACTHAVNISSKRFGV
eukprot:2823840-Pleurochrysis_carterae.AAC.2